MLWRIAAASESPVAAAVSRTSPSRSSGTAKGYGVVFIEETYKTAWLWQACSTTARTHCAFKWTARSNGLIEQGAPAPGIPPSPSLRSGGQAGRRRVQTAGHDAAHTRQLTDQNRTHDEVINELSLREQRVVVTKDSDFYHSHLLHGKPWKLLLIRTGNVRTRELKALFQ